MTVALISLAVPQAVVTTFPGVPPSLSLPDGRQVFGATVGWVSQDGGFSLVNVVPFVVPGGQQISGPASYSVSNGVVTQTFPTQAVPPGQTAIQGQQAALLAGATLTWTVSTALNGTYPTDPTTLLLMITEAVAFLELGTFSSGGNTTQFPTTAGVLNTMTAAQFKAFFIAVLKFVRLLQIWEVQTAAGLTPTIPSNAISVTG